MKIGNTKHIEPIELSLLDNANIKTIFSNRNIFHNEKVPKFACYIEKKAWDAFIAYANQKYTKDRHEATGIIIGHFLKDDHGVFTVGTNFEMGTGSSTGVWCEISTEDNARINNVCIKRNMHQIVWIHSHPKLGVFYSSTDDNTLKTMYYANHIIGIVVDNIQNESLSFKITDSEIKEFKDYFLFNDLKISSSIFKPFNKKEEPEKSKETFESSNNLSNNYEISKSLSNLDLIVAKIEKSLIVTREEFISISSDIQNISTLIDNETYISKDELLKISSESKLQFENLLEKINKLFKRIDQLNIENRFDKTISEVESIKNCFIELIDKTVLSINEKINNSMREILDDKNKFNDDFLHLKNEILRLRKQNIWFFFSIIIFIITLIGGFLLT